ncbi:MAG: Fic family protein [Nannocystaceae bacterium]|nr:Fic family protein [Nannocystaceae bacterium]
MKIPARPPAFRECFAALAASELADFAGFSSVDDRGRYLHWDELRHREPPAGLSHEAWWGAFKLARNSASKPLGLQDPAGRAFSYSLPDQVLRSLHGIDSNSHGSIGMGGQLRSSQARDQYIVTSLMEEAITSSQLEGASTTRKAAKEMLRTKRKPRTKHEQMIFNNYRAMEWVRDHVDEPLSPALVFELHRHVTVDTLEHAEDAGRFRRPDETVFVVSDSGDVLHEPPPADSLPDRLDAMCAFANDDGARGPFMPPIVRAILVHFWLAYDHPFVDGNGRTARALFYWSALRSKYWLLEFVTISSVIKKAPAKYGRAFLHAETDDNDATYFVIHQLGVITRAVENLKGYIQRSVEDQRAFEGALRTSSQYNHRQTALLRHALRHPGADYSIAEHQSYHAIAYQTARTDLLGLEKAGLFRSWKRSKALHFGPAPSFEGVLRETTEAE